MPADAVPDGAAGTQAGSEVLLQLRGARTHNPGTWSLPGGARRTGEKPLATALREAQEEAGIDPAAVSPRWWRIEAHGNWTYTTVAAEAAPGLTVALGPADWESAGHDWTANPADGRPLHPGFAATWPALAPLLGARLELIVDGANVVGSRPDGWWHDRAGAAGRLLQDLAALATSGLAQALIDPAGPDVSGWWPAITLVVEGQAKPIAAQPGGPSTVNVVGAPGEGDDQIVREAAAAVARLEETSPNPASAAVVVTADKYLAQRVKAAGAQVMTPGALRRALP
ncbi:MAG: NUDIX domain-containing protein [Bifidobacteriaceae bacterium]|jgi:8-oxo-dGTP pyrophosphatase MutT (NUDIX family)|nr:NUDIX domain-containing protein [Bifidobacteriaceae bacterium]